MTFSPIKEFTENAVITEDGQRREVDVLVCATGFDVSFRPKYPIVGIGGVNLATAWEKQPETYLSTTAPGFPNYFSRYILLNLTRIERAWSQKS